MSLCVQKNNTNIQITVTTPLSIIQKQQPTQACHMYLFSRSFADIVLREREERKRAGRGMADGGGDKLGGTEIMDGVSEREP